MWQSFLGSFIHFWLWWVFVAARGLSLIAVSRGYSWLGYMAFSLRWLLLLWSTGSRCVGFSSCSSWTLERGLSSRGAWTLIAPQHVESSQTRDWTHVPCIGRWILNHWATREVHGNLLIVESWGERMATHVFLHCCLNSFHQWFYEERIHFGFFAFFVFYFTPFSPSWTK